MTTQTCPAAEALKEYAIGNCDDEAGEAIEQHLASCPACEETLAQFDSTDDTLTRHLPLVASNRLSERLESPPWLDRLRNCPPGLDVAQVETRGRAPHPTPAEGIANYELLRILGQGGMGVVYLARHMQLNRRVAVKVLSSRTMASADAQSRFTREIQLLGNLNHAGIVMATDAGTAPSGAYLVMELVEGADLATLVRQTGPLSVAHACEVARQMSEALAAAHAVGVIHRDVKPSNVMIDRQQGRVRLLDFGLARLATPLSESEDTSVGRLLGTLDYMSPEQAKGEQAVDERADLYGLGATLFYLLTGQPPHGSHAGRPLLAHLAAITRETPPRVSALRPNVLAELDDFLARLLAVDPAERPDSAASVAEEMARWAGGGLATRVAELPSALDAENGPSTDLPESQRLLMDLLGPRSSSDDAGDSANKRAAFTSHRGRIGRSWPWLTAVAALAAVVWLGVTILLTTPDGTLRIESEADNIRVEVVDEEDQVHEVQIKRGTNETELRAGKYRVRLAGRHDGLSLDRDVITLQSGTKTVARITRADDAIAGQTAQPLAGASGAPEPLYEGRKESEWRHIYEAETALVAKLKAAEALMNLVSRLPAEEQIDRIIELGSEIVESNWGDDSLLFALQTRDPTRGLRYRRWQGQTESGLAEQYIGVLSQAYYLLQQLPPSVLAKKLCAEVLRGSDPRSGISGALLRFGAKKSIRIDSAAKAIVIEELDVPLTGIDRSAICLLIRAEYVADEQRTRHDLVNDLNDLIVRLNETPPTEFRDDVQSALLYHLAERGNQYGGQLDKEAAAALVFEGGLPFIPDIGLSYSPASVTDARDQIAWFLDGWVAVLNDYLASHFSAPNTIAPYKVQNLERVVRLYSDGDEWPVERTASLLTEQLRGYYTADASEETQQTANDLLPANVGAMLAMIVHITGEIPDFVRTGSPQASPVREELQRLEDLLYEKIPPQRVVAALEKFDGLLDAAPYEIVRLSIGQAEEARREIRISRISELLLYATSSVSGIRDRRNPPTDPVLLLAILADLTGQSEVQDERIASLFARTGRSSEIILTDPLRNILSGQLKARRHVRRLLEKMATNSKSQTLIDAIGEIDATLVTPDPEDASPSENETTSEREWSRELRARYIYHRMTQISDPRRLRDQTVLESVALHGEAIKDEDLVFLSTQSGLRELSLVDMAIDGTGLRHLAGLDELRRLSLVGPSVTDEWLECMPELTGLTNLGLSFTSVTDKGLQNLKKFPNLEGLGLNNTGIGDEGLEVLQHLPDLTSLSLKRTQVSDAGLLQLRHVPKLESFSLASPYVHGPGLTHAQKLKNLRSLQFVGPSATDDWMHPVEPLRNVEWLELHSTNVTADGLAAISHWANLKRLYLNNNPINDEMVVHLKDLYRLTGVELNRTNVTPEGLARLREALPDASVEGGAN